MSDVSRGPCPPSIRRHRDYRARKAKGVRIIRVPIAPALTEALEKAGYLDRPDQASVALAVETYLADHLL